MANFCFEFSTVVCVPAGSLQIEAKDYSAELLLYSIIFKNMVNYTHFSIFVDGLLGNLIKRDDLKGVPKCCKER